MKEKLNLEVVTSEINQLLTEIGDLENVVISLADRAEKLLTTVLVLQESENQDSEL